MLEAIRFTTGGYVRAAVEQNMLYFYARGDDGRTINLARQHPDAATALEELDTIHGLVVYYGLTVTQWARTDRMESQ